MKKPIQITSITEMKKVTKASVECDGCGLPASLNAERLCSHCKVCPRGRVSGPTIWERVRAWFHRSDGAEPLTTIK